METTFNNRVLNNDIRELMSNLENFEFSIGKVSGNSIEVYDKSNQSQGSYVYNKNIKHRDEDYNTLLEVIENNLVN
jgi:hypothetical protein